VTDEPPRLADGLDRVLAGLGAPKATALAALYDRWSEVVGEQAAAHARPLALRAGTLVIGVDDAALATELRYRRAELVDRLDEVLGVGVVGGVEVRIEAPR
jgi:predicted nucleic acid-binding Zn ribbon protein